MSDNQLPPEMASAVKHEVKQAMDEWARDVLFTRANMEVFWGTAFEVLQDKAQEHTGKFVVASIGGLLRKLTVFLVLGGLVYIFGGWSALVGFFKSISSSITH